MPSTSVGMAGGSPQWETMAEFEREIETGEPSGERGESAVTRFVPCLRGWEG